ncbi:MAG: carbohydrate ABC transporter permease [Defluviitaleaceae bacterium]|nr:carbohydrate ABC transporter permease [Defluviitaleaceae bacterium]MCL2238887.1 carbohydrate ABC transporter permease [Defluviitaleaceae bacterium]
MSQKSKNFFNQIPTYAGMYAVLIFVTLVSIGPLVWVVMSSFKTNAQIVGSPFSLPTAITFDAYREVIERGNFFTYAFNSFTYSTTATIASLIIYAMAAFVFAKYRFPLKTLLFSVMVATLLVPGHSRTQPIFSLIMDLGLFDTRRGIILVYISGGLAMSLFVLRSAFMSIPKEVSEAALIEGAGFVRNFFQMHVPLAKGGLATAGILMWLGHWNEYFFAALLTTSARTRTLPFALAFFSEMFSFNYTRMFAALTMVIIPGILVYALTQEQVQMSVATTGVKG